MYDLETMEELPRPDLDDLVIFHAVVRQGSFTGAAAGLGLPKGTVSKRVARLEARLGIRLLHRSTRKLHLTDVGETVFGHAEVVVAGLEAVVATTRDARSEPRGAVCFSCPQGLMPNLVGPMLRRFLHAFPHVRLELRHHNRAVDLIGEGVDVALRVRSELVEEGSMVIRRLGPSHLILVASPSLTAVHGGVDSPIDVATAPLLSIRELEQEWARLAPGGGMDGAIRSRLMCENLSELLAAAIDGLGYAMLSEHLCREALRDGTLLRLDPGCPLPGGIIHLAFASRRGLPPASRVLIDHLAAEFEAIAPSAPSA